MSIMSPINLLDLPVEILEQITRYTFQISPYIGGNKRREILRIRLVCRTLNYIVSYCAFYMSNLYAYEVRPNSITWTMSTGSAAWWLTEKALRCPGSNIHIIKIMHLAAANLLAASSVSVDRRVEQYRKFLWAAAAAAMLRNENLSLRELLNNPFLGEVDNNLLPVAILSGDEEVVRALLNSGTDVNNQHADFGRALHAAVVEGHAIFTRLLLDAGADINVVNGADETALHVAAMEGHESVMQVLLEKGASTCAAYYCDGRDITPLYTAVWFGHEGVVRILLESDPGTKPNGRQKYIALHYAIWWGNTEIVQLLLNAGAEINLGGKDKGTALHRAVLSGHAHIVQLLLEAGVETNPCGQGRNTALHRAVRLKDARIVHLLLDAGAKTNPNGEGPYTALHRAAKSGNAEIVKLLVEAGADKSAVCNGLTPMCYAQYGGHKQVIRVLRSAGGTSTDEPGTQWFDDFFTDSGDEKSTDSEEEDDTSSGDEIDDEDPAEDFSWLHKASDSQLGLT